MNVCIMRRLYMLTILYSLLTLVTGDLRVRLTSEDDHENYVINNNYYCRPKPVRLVLLNTRLKSRLTVFIVITRPCWCPWYEKDVGSTSIRFKSISFKTELQKPRGLVCALYR